MEWIDADSKAIPGTEFVGQIKNAGCQNADGAQSMFALTILEKIEESRLKFSQGSATVFWKMLNYEGARAKLANRNLNQLNKVRLEEHW